jgi:penicillin amidase
MIILTLVLSIKTSHAGPALILRDNYGVPHIYSCTLGGLFFGMGYAYAQDRLYQMEVFKRSFKGRLAEVLGSIYLFPDRMFLQAGYTQEELQASFDALSDEHQTVLTAFTDGINHYIREALADRENKLPYEFYKFGFDPEEWTPLDVANASGQTMKRPFGGYEITCAAILADLIERHGEEVGHQIFDDLVFREDPAAPTSIPSDGDSQFQASSQSKQRKVNAIPIKNIRKVARLINQQRLQFKEYTSLYHELINIPPWEHSQGLAISGSRSTTGNPLFLGGPQIDHSIPSSFYDVGLHGPGIDAVGTTLGSIPAVTMGYTRSTAFTLTGGLGNSEDYFVETLNPDNPNQYWHNGQWKDMIIRTESIPVKDSEPVPFEIKSTVHGPVMETDLDSNLAYTVQWANRENPLDIFVAVYEAMKAKNISEFRTAVNSKFPHGYNFLYADKQDNIGYFHAGNFPIRSSDIDDRLPTPGTGEYDWQEFMQDEDKPFAVNPSQGYLASWNNQPEAGWPQGDAVLLHPWGVGDRVYRYDELMAAKEKFSLEDLKNISFEVSMKDLNAPLTKPFLLEAASPAITDPRIAAAKQYLEEWDDFRVDGDKDEKYDTPAVAIWDAWWVSVLKNTFEDELGEYYSFVSPSSLRNGQDIYRSGAPLFVRALQGSDAALPPSRDYFNGQRDEVLLNSLIQALDQLEGEFGTGDISQWKKEIQTYPFIPSFMGMPTSEGEIDVTVIYMDRGTQEHLVELKKLIPSGLNIVPPGQSAFIDANQNVSPYFDDQIDLYNNWEYKNMNFTLREIFRNLTSSMIVWY